MPKPEGGVGKKGKGLVTINMGGREGDRIFLSSAPK